LLIDYAALYEKKSLEENQKNKKKTKNNLFINMVSAYDLIFHHCRDPLLLQPKFRVSGCSISFLRQQAPVSRHAGFKANPTVIQHSKQACLKKK